MDVACNLRRRCSPWFFMNFIDFVSSNVCFPLVLVRTAYQSGSDCLEFHPKERTPLSCMWTSLHTCRTATKSHFVDRKQARDTRQSAKSSAIRFGFDPSESVLQTTRCIIARFRGQPLPPRWSGFERTIGTR